MTLRRAYSRTMVIVSLLAFLTHSALGFAAMDGHDTHAPPSADHLPHVATVPHAHGDSHAHHGGEAGATDASIAASVTAGECADHRASLCCIGSCAPVMLNMPVRQVVMAAGTMSPDATSALSVRPHYPPYRPPIPL